MTYLIAFWHSMGPFFGPVMGVLIVAALIYYAADEKGYRRGYDHAKAGRPCQPGRLD